MDVELGVARTAEAMSVVLDGISSFKVKFDASDATRSKTLFGMGVAGKSAGSGHRSYSMDSVMCLP